MVKIQRVRQAGRQSDGYGGWCLELRRGGRYEARQEWVQSPNNDEQKKMGTIFNISSPCMVSVLDSLLNFILYRVKAALFHQILVLEHLQSYLLWSASVTKLTGHNTECDECKVTFLLL